MGSRRGRNAALAVAFALGGCTVGAPPGFSGGDSWTIPLVGPLEDGLLLVPALVNNKGPYVFAIDPDAHVSIVDQDVVKETGARVGEGPHLLDETDTQQPRFFAEILDWQLGTLEVKGPKSAQIVPAGTFDADGRRIHGVIGRDIIADSLVFQFDRDSGLIVLSTEKVGKPPPGARPFSYSILRSRIENVEVLPISRRLVTASVNGIPYSMHVDLGATPSQLRPRSWAKTKLVTKDLQIALVDEVGMPRTVKQQGNAETVSVAPGVIAQDVPFVPYADKRWLDQDLEGTLGLSFFKRYSVMANWDSHTFFVWPRRNPTENIVARIGRWQSKTLGSCEHVGCVKATLIDPLAGKPPEQMPATHPGVVASFVRDASSIQLPLEALVAVAPSGAGTPVLKWLIVNLPASVDRAMIHLPADYIGATLFVLDASPFPRACPRDGGCVDLLTPPQQVVPPPGTESPAPPPVPEAAVPSPPPPAPAPPTQTMQLTWHVVVRGMKNHPMANPFVDVELVLDGKSVFKGTDVGFVELDGRACDGSTYPLENGDLAKLGMFHGRAHGYVVRSSTTGLEVLSWAKPEDGPRTEKHEVDIPGPSNVKIAARLVFKGEERGSQKSPEQTFECSH